MPDNIKEPDIEIDKELSDFIDSAAGDIKPKKVLVEIVEEPKVIEPVMSQDVENAIQPIQQADNTLDEDVVLFEEFKEKFVDINTKIINDYDSDRGEVQEVIEYLKGEVLGGSKEKAKIEALVNAMGIKVDQAQVLQKSMDSLTKIIHAANQRRKTPKESSGMNFDVDKLLMNIIKQEK